MADSPPTPSKEHDTPIDSGDGDPAAASNGAITQELPTTGGLIESARHSRKKNTQSTIPLPDLGSQLLSPLQVGSLIAARYQVESVLSSSPESNIYDVVDGRGYLQCWACGSTHSEEGDTYCVECGAQLSGRHYRLQEFRLSSEAPTGDVAVPVHPAFLGNKVEGVSRVYDSLQSPVEGRAYVVWEAVNGSLFSTIASGAPLEGIGVRAEGLDVEQVTGWMTQAADVLVNLHSAGVVGCEMTAANLVVQPGERVTLIDPSGCRATNTDPPTAASEEAEDVRNLGLELERWYLSVRPMGDEGILTDASGDSMIEADGHILMVRADITGPLGAAKNLPVVLSKARGGSYTNAEEFFRALESLREASVPPGKFQLHSGRASDLGQVRQVNEDSVLALEIVVLEHEGGMPAGLYVIADGMGGHASGEVASSIAIRTIGTLVNSTLLGPLLGGESVAHDQNALGTLLRKAILEANRHITGLARDRQSDLGTTTVAAVVIGNQLTVANVGDSRAYLWHEQELTPITQDHSLVAQLVLAGQISPEELYTHPRRNEIYRALGDSRLAESEVDVFSHRLQPGDGLLLCSDGLWDFVRDNIIADTLQSSENEDPNAVCQKLIKLANDQGGEDNISAVFVRIMGTS